MVWITNQFGQVLLLKQKRGNKLWTLPGGKLLPREGLQEALEREVFEETGLRIHSIVFLEFFERPQKGAIAFLYSAKIRGRDDTVVPGDSEIEAAKFSAILPKAATPSLQFFWRKVHSASRAALRTE